ncbi:MAG TPA: hypothetical protein VGF35_07110, partial [Steroidobacteraceae bacterium]
VTIRAPVAARLVQQPVVMPGSAAARADAALAIADLERFGAGTESLTAQFSTALAALMDGRVSQQKFADELDQWLRPQWDELEAKLRRVHPAPGSQHERADEELADVVGNWQLALAAYAEDLRAQRFVDRPFRYICQAQLHQWRAERMQIELERPPASAAIVPKESH